MEQPKFKSKDVTEALEQVRAGFTISRMTLGTLSFTLYPLIRDEKWAKRFTRIQQEYHKFLLDSYKLLEKEGRKLQLAEEAEKKEA